MTISQPSDKDWHQTNMRKKRPLILLVSLVIAGGGILWLWQTQQNRDSKRAEQRFIQLMISRDEGSIQMSGLAANQSRNQEVKKLAAGIVASREAEITKMRQWYKQWWGVDVPKITINPHAGHSREVAPGSTTFDQVYLIMMAPHHDSSIKIAADILPLAWHKELQELAETILTSQTREMNQMRWLRQEVQSETAVSELLTQPGASLANGINSR